MSLRPSVLSTEMLYISSFFSSCWTAVQIACSVWGTEWHISVSFVCKIKRRDQNSFHS